MCRLRRHSLTLATAPSSLPYEEVLAVCAEVGGGGGARELRTSAGVFGGSCSSGRNPCFATWGFPCGRGLSLVVVFVSRGVAGAFTRHQWQVTCTCTCVRHVASPQHNAFLGAHAPFLARSTLRDLASYVYIVTIQLKHMNLVPCSCIRCESWR